MVPTQRENNSVLTATLTRSVRMSLRASLCRGSDYHQVVPAKFRYFSTWGAAETRNRLPLRIPPHSQPSAMMSKRPKLPDFNPDPPVNLPLNTIGNRLSVVSERSESCYEEQKLMVEMPQSSASNSSSTDKAVTPPLYDNIDIDAKLMTDKGASERLTSNLHRSFNAGINTTSKPLRPQKYHTVTTAEKKFGAKTTLPRTNTEFSGSHKPTRLHQRSRSYDFPLSSEPNEFYNPNSNSNRSCENIFGSYRKIYPYTTLYRSNNNYSRKPTADDNRRHYNSLPYNRQLRNRNFTTPSEDYFRSQEDFEFQKPFGNGFVQPTAYQFVPIVPTISGNCLFYPPIPPVPVYEGPYCNPYGIPPNSSNFSATLPSDKRSVTPNTKRTRNCVVGWMIGVTAALILILAITLFIQLQRDNADLTASLATANANSWTTTTNRSDPIASGLGITKPIVWKINQ